MLQKPRCCQPLRLAGRQTERPILAVARWPVPYPHLTNLLGSVRSHDDSHCGGARGGGRGGGPDCDRDGVRDGVRAGDRGGDHDGCDGNGDVESHEFGTPDCRPARARPRVRLPRIQARCPS